ncbi:uncharacterized protein METZ01_LOCUS515291 [marine metagenome]|uniref:Uncharacterized protein n=1 Tax=marine metagenome TaxID=408172 RepID=A0A383EZX2_9ZZZZ
MVETIKTDLNTNMNIYLKLEKYLRSFQEVLLNQ